MLGNSESKKKARGAHAACALLLDLPLTSVRILFFSSRNPIGIPHLTMKHVQYLSNIIILLNHDSIPSHGSNEC